MLHTSSFLFSDDSIPPTADAGSDVFINLPQNSVILDGKGSHDDFGIASYQWTKSLDSPAAGVGLRNLFTCTTMCVSF